MQQDGLFQTSCLMDLMQLISGWNKSMLPCLDECSKAMESESIPFLDELIRLSEPISDELEKANSIREVLSSRVEDLRYRRAALSLSRGMKSLPPEIIGRIFVVAGQEDHSTAIAISHVNRKWRSIALSTPELWSTVPFGYDTNYSLDLMSIYLERSMSTLLIIEYDAIMDEQVMDSLPLLLEHSHRWDVFRGSVHDASTLVEAIAKALPPPASLPKLTHFFLQETQSSGLQYPFPSIHFPVIQYLDLPSSIQGVDFGMVSTVEQTKLAPSSLAGLTSFHRLRVLYCNIKSDLMVDLGLSLHLPCLEDLEIVFDQIAWPLVSRIFHAMSYCTPGRIGISVNCPAGDITPSSGDAFYPSVVLFSRVLDLTFWVVGSAEPSTISLNNFEKILMKTSRIELLCIHGIPDLRLILRRMAKTFPHDLRRLELRRSGELAGELRNLLACRRKQASKPLELLSIAQCGIRSDKAAAQLGELVQQLEWSKEP